ncbi:hypothetical protein EYB26_000175 [Talaromyces marneffei]|uniref:uncharacterized protein n=1 Tax=Talaromyces marneffei TaxID=37727 RepID=UPI0012AAB76F|nr:uncharacterized protein EYB26_000175 [Talaromyces marneffei]QGA12531.1 hypothetical protein EYB26_000175 [Talaromyces marneffei]
MEPPEILNPSRILCIIIIIFIIFIHTVVDTISANRYLKPAFSSYSTGKMSLEDSYFLPTTPPGVARMHLIGLGPSAGPGSAHSRNTSGSSVHSHDSSPESIMTRITTPRTSISPNYQHGPQLLPKIRTQDVILEPASSSVGPRRHRRVLSNTRNPPGYMPYPTARPSALSRNVIEASAASDCGGLISPVSPASTQHPGVIASGLSSPIALTTSAAPAANKRKSMPSAGHSRSGSTSSIDEVTLSRYGYPTYRQLPKYVSQPEVSPISPVDPSTLVFPSYSRQVPSVQVPSVQVPCPVQLPTQQAYNAMPSPQHYDYLRVHSAQPSPVSFLAPPLPSPASSTTLLAYLTNTTPAVNLVRTVNYGPTRGLNDYFWWDIRQLRSWSSFSLNTFNEINGLTQLLKTPIPSHLTPQPMISSSRLTPESENALISLVGDIYAPRINAALRVSQGSDHMRLYVSPDANSPGSRGANGPHFLANYASDTDVTSSGVRRGRVVGIVKSFDRWNTGMRNEPPHRRVEYLRGLAHLQRCMREHSCRYGFIITEIELVCVRAGCDDGDDVPYFGYLELSSPIATKESSSNIDQHSRRRSSTPPHSSAASSYDDNRSTHSRSSSLSSFSSHQHEDSQDGNGLGGVPLTATLALYFLLMLSKSMPLPSQPSGHLNVGGPGALSRQRILPEPKDKWIPEPQLGEKREAKRVRGWIMPQDAWHRREGSRPKNNTNGNGGESGKGKRGRKGVAAQ